MKTAIWVGGAVFALSLGVLGCLQASGHSSDVAQRYAKSDELQPYATPYGEAYVIYNGIPVETTIDTDREEGSVELEFISFDETIDRERYEFDDSTFRYVGNTEEEFEPGIPLLRFPFDVGDDWTWAGSYHLAGIEREATAKISTGQDRLNTVAGEFGTVRVNVDLSIESGSAKPVAMKLTFWFAPKRGVVRREFDQSTTREPMPARTVANR